MRQKSATHLSGVFREAEAVDAILRGRRRAVVFANEALLQLDRVEATRKCGTYRTVLQTLELMFCFPYRFLRYLRGPRSGSPRSSGAGAFRKLRALSHGSLPLTAAVERLP